MGLYGVAAENPGNARIINDKTPVAVSNIHPFVLLSEGTEKPSIYTSIK